VPGDVVHAGTLDLRVGGVKAIVKEARHHPDWHSTSSGWDVAVLHLVSPLEGVALARLTTESARAGDTAWVVGWGATAEGSGTTPVLRHASLPVVAWATCQAIYGTLSVTDMCAGGEGADGCQGDSGGPLYAADGETVIGFTSRGIGCGRLGIPGVWNSVYATREWIVPCL
jgi:secreted trypsin-like serine protease